MHFEFIHEFLADFHLFYSLELVDVQLIHFAQSSEYSWEFHLDLLCGLDGLNVFLEKSSDADDVLVVIVEFSPPLADLTEIGLSSILVDSLPFAVVA